jgi:hypothetical protein
MSIWTALGAWAKSGAPSSSSVLNTGLQMYTNYRNRQNALSDQRALNAYNSPLQQMQRFKEAGLNPNLIYKQSNEGAPVRSTDYVAPQIKETQLDVLGKSTQIQLQKQAQTTANLQQKLIEAQINKTNADALQAASNTRWKDLDYARLKGQLPGLVDSVYLRNDQMTAEIQNKIADTSNKIAQLPILEVQKNKLDAEVDKLMRTNAFIEKSNNSQLAIQKAMVASIKVATDLTRKKIVTEDFNQEQITSQIRNAAINAYKEQDTNVDMSWIDKAVNIGSLLLPYGAARLLPKFVPQFKK